MPTVADPKNPRLALQADHAQIEVLVERLNQHVSADERAEACGAWALLEPTLLAHLDAEEGYLLPAVEAEEPAECERIRKEHAQIRRMVGEIGMALELHTARSAAIEAFSLFLKAHAEREDALLYSIAERHMPVVVARSLISRLRALRVIPKKPTVRRAVRAPRVANSATGAGR